MFNIRQGILGSRPAAVALALIGFAVLTAPFVILQSMHAFAATPPLPCAEGNYNGCTELSATPPEDLQSVPPNIVLMLDDSGSMAWDYMPDWEYLSNTSAYGTRNSGINGVYYNPETTYTPPPKATATGTAWQADGTWYPNSPGLTGAYTNGFAPPAATNIVGGSGYVGGGNGNSFNYTDNLATTLFTTASAPVDKGPAVWGGGTPYKPAVPAIPATPGGGCIAGYSLNAGTPPQCIRASVSPTRVWTCNPGDGGAYNSGGGVMMCHHYAWQEGHYLDTPYGAIDGGLQCTASGTTGPDAGGLCDYPPIGTIPPTPAVPAVPAVPATPNYMWVCPGGSSFSGTAPAAPPGGTAPECWTPPGSTSRIYVRGFTYVVGNPVQTNSHYVVPNGSDAPAGGWCSVLYYAWQKTNCVNVDDTSGTAAPSGVTAGQNVANWFSYYRTRLLMAKTGLMEAFISVDPKYRFGFASINGNGTIPGSPTPYTFDDSMAGGGSSTNKLAVVQPFGDGSSGTQKAQFWTWLANITANNGTPLRKALNAVGQYYQTADPWKTLSGDPGWTTGSTTQFTCRSSYTILTTDGFWNGDAPAASGSSTLANAASIDGPVNTAPVGNITQYTAVAPFSGGAVAGGSEPSLADVATYYWETDLNTSLANEVSASPADPASWQHMTTFTIGLGFTPVGILPAGTTVPQIFGWAGGGAAIAGFSWPTPASNSVYNIADLAHAAVNGHGDFFNVTDPSKLAAAFSKALADIGARNVAPSPVAVNSNVLAVGAAAFSSGYATGDWSGQLQAVALLTDGSAGQTLWKAEDALNADFHSSTLYANRKVYTSAYTSGTFSAFQFNVANVASLDTVETAGLEAPALAGGNDTLANRIKYLLGDNYYEAAPFRTRTNLLGAIIHSDPVYVAGATGIYRSSWPTIGTVAPPEASSGAEAYSTFVNAQTTRAPRVYVGANDGMVHAFDAPVAQCAGTIAADGSCSVGFTFTDADNGHEEWAFVPRAVYANLGNLTNNTNFQYRPTVDSTPVTGDVFFSQNDRSGGAHHEWHTILAGGVGLGGRGVYALDITDPTTFSASNVLWEFDSDMTVSSGCVSIQGSATDSIGCRGTDLGYTVPQPNISRLANGEWVVLVPNGYFPDCSTPDAPTADTASCQAIAAQAPKDASGNPYSALFVLDAQTGKMVAELKTPVIAGVTSFGLAKPVLGDYNADQVDDVAFAGDVQGNLWRFDLSDTNPANWTVSLVYQGLSAGGHQGVQPITTMPRLFPDPDTNRFMVLFGTGKYLGVGDNSDSSQQAIYSVRDTVGTSYTQADLVQQYLHETVAPVGDPLAGSTLRCVTGAATDTCTSTATAINSVSAGAGGWYVNLYTTSSGVQNDAGERVVVNPGAVFATNTVVFESLITGAQSTDACNPSTQGAILALNATTGSAAGMSALGGWPMAGGRINNARTSGSLPIVSALNGGKAYFPGAPLSPSGSPTELDVPFSRRRSWQVLMNDQ